MPSSTQNNGTAAFTSEPPSYDAAVTGHPPPARHTANHGHASDTDTSDDEDPLRGVDPELRQEMDDEHRDLPEGWVRAFDTKTMHQFFVDTKTQRSIWVHPYDDPEYLRSLPDTHPAHPDSEPARAVRKHSEDEMLRAQKAKAARKEERSLGGKIKDKLIGTKEERKAQKEREAKAFRDQQQAYIMRRKALIEQRNDPSIQRHYASNPYSYAAPSMAFSRRGGMYSSPYGYGYGGGYGRRGYGGYGMGVPLMGGLGGGMLLGSMMGGGMGYGGFGGGMGDCGGMGGGDMGGGGDM